MVDPTPTPFPAPSEEEPITPIPPGEFDEVPEEEAPELTDAQKDVVDQWNNLRAKGVPHLSHEEAEGALNYMGLGLTFEESLNALAKYLEGEPGIPSPTAAKALATARTLTPEETAHEVRRLREGITAPPEGGWPGEEHPLEGAGPTIESTAAIGAPDNFGSVAQEAYGYLQGLDLSDPAALIDAAVRWYAERQGITDEAEVAALSAMIQRVADWESGLGAKPEGDGGMSWGLFHNHLEGRGAGYTQEQLLDPITNTIISVEELLPIGHQAYPSGVGNTADALVRQGQRPDPKNVEAVNNMVAYVGGGQPPAGVAEGGLGAPPEGEIEVTDEDRRNAIDAGLDLSDADIKDAKRLMSWGYISSLEEYGQLKDAADSLDMSMPALLAQLRRGVTAEALVRDMKLKTATALVQKAKPGTTEAEARAYAQVAIAAGLEPEEAAYAFANDLPAAVLADLKRSVSELNEDLADPRDRVSVAQAITAWREGRTPFQIAQERRGQREYQQFAGQMSPEDYQSAYTLGGGNVVIGYGKLEKIRGKLPEQGESPAEYVRRQRSRGRPLEEIRRSLQAHYPPEALGIHQPGRVTGELKGGGRWREKFKGGQGTGEFRAGGMNIPFSGLNPLGAEQFYGALTEAYLTQEGPLPGQSQAEFEERQAAVRAQNPQLARELDERAAEEAGVPAPPPEQPGVPLENIAKTPPEEAGLALENMAKSAPSAAGTATPGTALGTEDVFPVPDVATPLPEDEQARKDSELRRMELVPEGAE